MFPRPRMCDADRRDHRPCQAIARSVFVLELLKPGGTLVRHSWGACDEHNDQVKSWANRVGNGSGLGAGRMKLTETRL